MALVQPRETSGVVLDVRSVALLVENVSHRKTGLSCSRILASQDTPPKGCMMRSFPGQTLGVDIRETNRVQPDNQGEAAKWST